MKKFLRYLFLFFIFFAGLFIFRTIFSALILVLVYSLVFEIFERIWRRRHSPILLFFIKPIINLLLAVLVGLSFYILIYLPAEFLLTEVLMQTAKIPSYVGVVFLVSLVIIFSFIDWQRKLKEKKSWILILLFLQLNGLVYLEYHQEKVKREYLPKIYEITPNWGIQGQIVTIEGLNFGSPWRRGRISFNNRLEMVIKSWNDNIVVFEQPVPDEFGKGEIRVIRDDGVFSNGIFYEIRNPDFLK